jgi:hypothetical protein
VKTIDAFVNARREILGAFVGEGEGERRVMKNRLKRDEYKCGEKKGGERREY